MFGACPGCAARNARRVKEPPPPAREVRGSGWTPPKGAIIAPKFRCNELRLPHLPKNFQNAIELARIAADREFRDATSDPAISDRKVRERRVEWVFVIMLGFTKTGCDEIRQGRRNLAQVVQWRDELLNDAATSAGIEIFRDEVRDELYRLAEWRQLESLLEGAAKAGPVEPGDGANTALPKRGVKFNNKMREKREGKGWTHEELEAQTQNRVNVSTISRAERHIRIDLSSAKIIAEALETDLAELIDKARQLNVS
jgi:hypothetical protein